MKELLKINFLNYSILFSYENGALEFKILYTSQPQKVFGSICKNQLGFLLEPFHESKNFKKHLVLHQSPLIDKEDLPWTTLEERNSMV